jgi:hypothetical protein
MMRENPFGCKLFTFCLGQKMATGCGHFLFGGDKQRDKTLWVNSATTVF